jgi:hypothetical protein
MFVDGRRSRFSWGPAEIVEEPYYPQNDRLARDIERMDRRCTDMGSILSSGQGEAAAATVAGPPLHLTS